MNRIKLKKCLIEQLKQRGYDVFNRHPDSFKFILDDETEVDIHFNNYNIIIFLDLNFSENIGIHEVKSKLFSSKLQFVGMDLVDYITRQEN